MITKKEIQELKPMPFEQRYSHTRYRDGRIVTENLEVWGQDKDGAWGWVEPSVRIKKGKFERGYYVVRKK